jgi:hypothetical protein
MHTRVASAAAGGGGSTISLEKEMLANDFTAKGKKYKR